MDPGSSSALDREAMERWFLARGLPHFIEDYSATRDVFTRSLGILLLVLLVELSAALDSSWPWWLNALVGGAGFAALAAVWGALNVRRGRSWKARPESVGPAELAVFVLLPASLAALAGGQWVTAVNLLVGNLVFLGLVYLTTSYGVIPMTRWAAGRLVAQLSDLLGLMVRSLPLLLLFVIFLFLTSEAWQVASGLDGAYLPLTVGLLAVLGAAFVVSRMPREVGALARFGSAEEMATAAVGTPAAGWNGWGTLVVNPASLSRRQWGNVGLVVLVGQGLQVVFASAMIGLFLVAFGVVAVTPETVGQWIAGEPSALIRTELWGREIALTVELLQVAGLLAGVSGLSFTLSLLTDAAYRQEFLEETLGEVRQAFAVRGAYLASVAPPAGAAGTAGPAGAAGTAGG